MLWLQVIEELHSFDKLNDLSFPDFNRLKEQLYLQLLAKINQIE